MANSGRILCKRTLHLLFFSLIIVPALAQTHRITQTEHSDEYRMSHLEIEAGGITGLVLPERISKIPKKSYKWVPVESNKINIVEKTETSASVRAIKSGSTVVNYIYKYEIKGEDKPIMKNGQQVIKDGVPQVRTQMIEKEGSYPFTLNVHKIEAEAIVAPSVIRIEWGELFNLDNNISFYPKYSESSYTFTIDDINIAEGISAHKLKGENLGSTFIHFVTPKGLQAESKIEVIMPTLRSISIERHEKKIKVGDVVLLKYTYSPSKAEATFTWSSSNPEVISISNEGELKALSTGKSVITITSNNGIKDNIEFKVTK